MIIGHIPYCPNGLKIWLYSFHMPLFFFLAGITFNNSKYKILSTFIRSKVKGILIPYFIFAFCAWLYSCLAEGITFIRSGVFHYEVLIGKLLSTFVQVRSYENSVGIWFLPCIFITFIFLYFIRKICKGNRTYSCILAGGGLIVGYIYSIYMKKTLPWGIEAALIATFFMMMGNVGKEIWYEKNTLRTRTKVDVIVIISLCINIVFTVLNFKNINRHVDMWSNTYGNLIWFLLAAFSGIIFVISISKHIQNSNILKILGRHSIYYYGLHLLIINAFSKITVHFSSLMNNCFIKWIVIGIECVVLIVVLHAVYPLYEKGYKKICSMVLVEDGHL